MRYLPPFADEVLTQFKQIGIDKVILFPMYPHYSFTTTLSSIEDIKDGCKRLNYYPEIRVVEPYFDDYDYIQIQYNLIKETISGKKSEDYHLILSAHGLPKSIILSGDPYEIEVNSNVSALKIFLKERDLNFAKISLAYQSKIGNSRWLEPNLVDVLRKPDKLKVLIFPLSFTIDNSETVFELSIEHFEIAKKIGYKEYLVSKSPNDRDEFVKFIASKVRALDSEYVIPDLLQNL
jgi:ferrochelatase